MLKIQVDGRGMIPRGLGLAPRKNPFNADYDLIGTIMATPGLSLRYINPETGQSLPLNRGNLKRVWEKFGREQPKSTAPITTPNTGAVQAQPEEPPAKEPVEPAGESGDEGDGKPPWDEDPPATEVKEGAPETPAEEIKSEEPAAEVPAVEETSTDPADEGEKEEEAPAEDAENTTGVPSFTPVLNPNADGGKPAEEKGGIAPVFNPNGDATVETSSPTIVPGSIRPVMNPNDRQDRGGKHGKHRH